MVTLCAVLVSANAAAEVVVSGEDADGQGYRDTLDFDPGRCATSPGAAIIARLPSGMAFAFPLTDYISLDARGFEFLRGETEPWGCPDNPVRIRSAGFALQYQALIVNQYGPDIGLAGLYDLQIIGLNSGAGLLLDGLTIH